MKQPDQGRLLCKNGEWLFLVGRKSKSKTIPLANFSKNVTSLTYNNKLFDRWKPKSTVFNVRHLYISDIICHQIIARKVSAKYLHQLTASSLANHYKLYKYNCNIWDCSYMEEYYGL